MKPFVFVDRQIPPEALALLAEYCEVEVWDHQQGSIPKDLLREKLLKAVGLMTGGRWINEELLSQAPRLKAVSTISVGYNHFDLEAMKRRGVIGTHTPQVLDDTVADLTFALILSAARRVAELDRYVKEGHWKSGDGVKLFGKDVHHAKLGIVGMGRIGEAVARRAKFGFEMDVVYYNRTRKPEVETAMGVQYAPLNELLAVSDFVVLLTPLTPETTKLIGRQELALMKPDAVFINVSRGQTVDEEALIEALQNGTIGAAGLDVFEKEPLEQGHPFMNMSNVVTLPHIGSATTQTRNDMALLAARNMVEALTGETLPKHIVKELK
ncbi:D-glycerate dehydrogenase [Paenibacillus sp. N4]|uniref:2-hydroxyacid dehydrogenase n=1 Tax=Paenibacillus vietnamensis TaxID=2590547 RepID=UPI001CD0EE1A|nr:D-glycerate dehydrogenase [Paenibacillus vietnamensis]MCA0754322.1 D-glycerate dehydrogenase [Paenibacillus vietnamensis]